MIEDIYMIAIVGLLPLTAGMLVTQVNPYHALIIRGILGAVAALVYVLFGAADVALTEALVGTMLSITLYAVAVRSSMSVKLGVLDGSLLSDDSEEPSVEAALPFTAEPYTPSQTGPLLAVLRQLFNTHQMRVELVGYPTLQSLQIALKSKDIHAFCLSSQVIALDSEAPYRIHTRIPRLHDILQDELSPTLAIVTYHNPVTEPDPIPPIVEARTFESVESRL